jgi:hypothetical protein
MMNRASRVPPVVAELGRPETADETADRLAQNSRNHRARSTINNLALSLIATLGAVIAIVLLVPRAEAPVVKTVDFASVAAHAQSGFADALAVPALPDGWHSNAATTHGESGGIRSWYIGFITPKKQFIGLTQGFGADQRWLATQLANSSPTATVMVDGVAWTAYDNRAVERDVGNVKYALVTEEGDSTYVLFGTADTGEFHALASALTEYLDQRVEDAR